MSTTRPQPGARVARTLAATAAAGTLTFFAGMAAAQADDSGSAAPSSSDVVSAQPQVTAVTSATAADSDTSSAAADNCPATVVIVLGSITVSGNQVTVSFTHTGPECPNAASAVLHVHENLLSTPNSGSDPIQLNKDFDIGPGSGNSVTVPLLDGVEGKCFVQVDAHASGVNRGRFFPTAVCPSSSPSQSVSPSQSTSQSQIVNPPTPPSSSSPAKVVVPPVSSPTAQAQEQNSAPVLASTGTRAQNPLVLGASLLLAGAMLLAAGLPGQRWRTGLRALRTLRAGGRH
jgi:hypothetical protein